MLTAMILVVFAVVVLVFVLLVVVAVAIRREPHDVEMSDVAPSLIAVEVQRMLRLYVRKPTPPTNSDWQRSGNHRVDRQTTSRPSGEGGENPLQAYTVERVAKMLHVGRDKVYYLLRTGRCAASRSASCAGSPNSNWLSSSLRSTTPTRIRDV